ncbi:MAG: hypothetical protein V3W41_22630 [Planctomycetota bacterium]
MKAWILVVGFALMASTTQAQNRELKRYDQKIHKPFATAVAWERDFDAALSRATNNEQIIFAYFTRSYSP